MAHFKQERKTRARLVPIEAARTVANTIKVIRVVLLILAGIATLVAASDSPLWLIGGLVGLLSIYVSFGWFEQTLLMLAQIAANTLEKSGDDEFTAA